MLNYNAKRLVILSICIIFLLSTIKISLAQELVSTKAGEEVKNPTDEILRPFKLTILKNENYETDLQTILKVAIDNNIPLSIQKEQEKIDKLDVIVNKSELLPSISANYAQSRFQGGFQIFGNATFKMYRTILEPQLQLDYTIFSGGETIYKILAAKRVLKATQYSIMNTQNDLLMNVANTYNELLKANLRMDIAKKQFDETAAILNLNKQRLDNGLGTILDVSQSEEQYSESKYSIIQADKDILATSQKLNELLNLPMDVNVLLSDLSISKKEIIKIDNPNILLEIAYENRPDLALTKQQKEIYKAQKGIARSRFFPKLTLSSYIGDSGPRMSDLTQQRYIGYTVSMDLLKNMGVNYLANYKKSGPMIKQADLQIQQKMREIDTDISNSLLDYEGSEKNIKVAETALKFAEDSYKYATERLKAGVGTNIDVISAQANLTLNRTQYYESIANFNNSQVKLLHALGLISIENICSDKAIVIDESFITKQKQQDSSR